MTRMLVGLLVLMSCLQGCAIASDGAPTELVSDRTGFVAWHVFPGEFLSVTGNIQVGSFEGDLTAVQHQTCVVVSNVGQCDTNGNREFAFGEFCDEGLLAIQLREEPGTSITLNAQTGHGACVDGVPTKLTDQLAR